MRIWERRFGVFQKAAILPMLFSAAMSGEPFAQNEAPTRAALDNVVPQATPDVPTSPPFPGDGTNSDGH